MNDNTKPAATSGDAPDLQQLKALALAATPGPWDFDTAETPVRIAGGEVVGGDALPYGDVYTVAELDGPDGSEPINIAREVRVADGSFIAAANPTVVLDLIARIERATAPHGSAAPTEVAPDWKPDWQHAANEWADTAYNGLQHLRNIEDIIAAGRQANVTAARENMERCCQSAKAVADAVYVSQRAAAPVSGGELEAAIKEVNAAFMAYANGETRSTDDFNKAVDKIRAAVSASQAASVGGELARQIIDDTNATLREQSETMLALKVENDQLRAAVAAAKVPTDEQLQEIQQRMWKALDRKACPGVWMQIASDAIFGFKKDSYGNNLAAPVEQGHGAADDESKWVDRLSYDAQVDEWAIERSNLEAEIERLKAAPVGAGVVPEALGLAIAACERQFTGNPDDAKHNRAVGNCVAAIKKLLTDAPSVPQGWKVSAIVDPHYAEAAFSVTAPDGSSVIIRSGAIDPTETIMYRYLDAATAHPVAADGLPEQWQQVLDEVARATRKFPTWPTDPLHAVAVLGEEFGELTKAVLQTTYEPHKVQEGELRTEAIQTAAMALRFLASLGCYEFARGDQHSQGAASRTTAHGGAQGEQT